MSARGWRQPVTIRRPPSPFAQFVYAVYAVYASVLFRSSVPFRSDWVDWVMPERFYRASIWIPANDTRE